MTFQISDIQFNLLLLARVLAAANPSTLGKPLMTKSVHDLLLYAGCCLCQSRVSSPQICGYSVYNEFDC